MKKVKKNSVSDLISVIISFYLFDNIQGCLANSDGANSDDRANSDDFLGKSLELICVIIPTFSQILTA